MGLPHARGGVSGLRPARAGKPARSSIRIWIPGCATGEEVYSLAILLLECLGSRISDYDIKLFGTDIDDSATEVARRGRYAEPTIEGVKPDILKRYFIHENRKYKVIKRVRDMCVFARQDLVSDPPFLRMDLISCRNLMIYLNNDLQEQIINNFHYSLQPGGFLFLGKSESIGPSGTQLFEQIDGQHKIYIRRDSAATRVRISGFTPALQPAAKLAVKAPKQLKKDAMHQCLLTAYGPPSVLVTAAYEPVQFFGDVSRYLTLPEGVAEFNLLSLSPPGIRTELRALLHRIAGSKKDMVEHLVEYRVKDEPQRLKLVARNVMTEGDTEKLFLVSFEPAEKRFVESESDSPDEAELNQIEQLQNELSGTREHLQAVVEELETSNEELQSLNEELQASSEELQASNEELETTNEELQATNEELTTVNDELQAKSVELSELNETLANIQNSINMGLIVLDEKFRLVRYTPKVVRLFGILPDDIGQKITGIPSHIAIERFDQVLTEVTGSGTPVSMEVTRLDDTFVMTISPYLNQNKEIAGVILTFSDVSELANTRRQVRQAEQKFRLITDSLHEIVWMSSASFKELEYLSPAYEDYAGTTPGAQATAADYLRTIHPDDRDRFIREVQKPAWDMRYRICHVNGQVFALRDRGARVRDEAEKRDVLVSSAINITRSEQIANELALSENKFRGVYESSSVGIALATSKGILMDANPYFCDWLGYARDEMLGMHFSEITHQDDLNIDLSLFREVISGRKKSYQLKKRYITKTGETVAALLNVSVVYQADEVSADEQLVVAVIQDLSGRSEGEKNHGG